MWVHEEHVDEIRQNNMLLFIKKELQKSVTINHARLFLLLPLFLISGIFAYEYCVFLSFPLLLLFIVLCLFILLFWRHSNGILFCFKAIGFFVLGAFMAYIQINLAEKPILNAETVAFVDGYIETLEEHKKGHRMVVHVEGFQAKGEGDYETPEIIRITAKKIEPDLLPGDAVYFVARLRPPPPPIAPWGYQFQKRAYYEGWGAVGYAYSTVKKSRYQKNSAASFKAGINRLRMLVAQRIAGVLKEEPAAMAIALTTGLRDRLSSDTIDALRQSGLAHILAISGLHMALVSGGIYWFFRLLFTLPRSIALHYPIKKWAACAALVSATFYLLLSGNAVSTQRAYIMVFIAFIAVLFDKPAITMRNLAIAALIVAICNPQSVLGPGFQMSFAATAGLIALYEQQRNKTQTNFQQWHKKNILSKILFVFASIAVTSIVAILATSPIAAYHFGQFANYGLLGNLAAMPLVVFWIMPLGTIALFMMPFGLEAFPLYLMGLGLDYLIQIATTISQWPGATSEVSRLEGIWMFLFIMLLLFGIILKGGGRLFILFALPLLFFAKAPAQDLYASQDSKNILVRLESGEFVKASKRLSLFHRDMWLGFAGQRDDTIQRKFNKHRKCKKDICLVNSKLGIVLQAKQGENICSFLQKKNISKVQLAFFQNKLSSPLKCLEETKVFDKKTLQKMGAISIRKTETGLRIECVSKAYQQQAWWQWGQVVNVAMERTPVACTP